MCGIAGIWWPEGRRQAEAEAAVSAMTAWLRHRGPDARAVWANGAAGIALGHARLSILDLSPAGAQPMISASGRHVIVFNGEIYNHLELRRELESRGAAPRWRGHSDTETLLALIDQYGIEETLNRATGMFGLAVWDRVQRTLTLARDRLGEKPLYFGRVGPAMVFASELKAFRAVPGFAPQIDRQAMASLLRFGYIPGPRAIWEGIRKLPPGAFIRFRQPDDASEPQAFWSLAEAMERGRAEPLARDWKTMCDATEAVLADVVESQLISDVPIGIFLSGGIDSSLVTALACARSTARVRTFSIGFAVSRFNEAPHARAVAAHLGTDHTELVVTEADALAVIPDLPAIYDEPFADSSQIPTTLLSRLTRQHVTVALSGDGGDEMFGGYNRYKAGPPLINWLRRSPGVLRRAAASAAATLDRPWLRPFVRAAIQPTGLPRTTADRLSLIAELMGQGDEALDVMVALTSLNWRPGDIAGPDCHGASIREAWRAIASQADDDASRMMAVDALTYLPDDILVKVDRAAMSASLETRAPFLDRRTLEHAWRLPIEAKVEGRVGKRVLREILGRHVPQAAIERPKQGFSIPLDDWLRGPLSGWAGDLLAPGAVRSVGLLEPSAVALLWERHRRGTEQAGARLWPLLMLQAWWTSDDSGRQDLAAGQDAHYQVVPV
jgi:asparagine synthase (glutamine-hydrolysing)